MKENRTKELFLTFLKIGAFTFGGGYAMIPLIKREVVENKKWLTSQEIFDVIAIAESTPGPLAINAATFVGSKVGGFKGALAATSGVVLPSFVVILVISHLLQQIEHLKVVKDAFLGIRTGVFVLIASAFVSLFRQMKKQMFTYIVMALAIFLILAFDMNSIFVLLICACCGITWSCYIGKKVAK